MLLLAEPPPAPAPPPPPPIVTRGNSRLIEVNYQVNILGYTGNNWSPAGLALPASDLALALVIEGPFSRIQPSSISASVMLDGRPLQNLAATNRLAPGVAEGQQMATVALPPFVGQSILWQTRFVAECFSVHCDEVLAAKITWPREMPPEVKRFLEPEVLIESEDARIRAYLDQVSGGQLRLVPPFYAAKDIIRSALLAAQSVNGTGVIRQGLGSINGLQVFGAVSLLTSGQGTPSDLTCLSVALLRAAGIPARPVLGVTRFDDPDRKLYPDMRNGPWVWGEFWLPHAGWIPFDPMVMRRQAVRQLDVRSPWKGLGTIKDLNGVVPMAWSFVPPRPLFLPGFPAMWASTISNLVQTAPAASPYSNSAIGVTIINRGPGPGD
ncbi:MAG: transglutaminase domain-containing protein [Phycisphaerae bacterium]|nr:transglutaminase domain-containing protein [Phycisphaerae bacterium]